MIICNISHDNSSVRISDVHLRQPSEPIGSSNVPQLDVKDLVLDFDGFYVKITGDGGLGLFYELVLDVAVDETSLSGSYFSND